MKLSYIIVVLLSIATLSSSKSLSLKYSANDLIDDGYGNEDPGRTRNRRAFDVLGFLGLKSENLKARIDSRMNHTEKRITRMLKQLGLGKRDKGNDDAGFDLVSMAGLDEGGSLRETINFALKRGRQMISDIIRDMGANAGNSTDDVDLVVFLGLAENGEMRERVNYMISNGKSMMNDALKRLETREGTPEEVENNKRIANGVRRIVNGLANNFGLKFLAADETSNEVDGGERPLVSVINGVINKMGLGPQSDNGGLKGIAKKVLDAFGFGGNWDTTSNSTTTAKPAS